MRFDDVLETVRTLDLTAPAGATAAWRQLVDLVGRGRVPADDATLATLADIRARVPADARAASARALFGARPPAALVTLLAGDDIAVAAPVLRTAVLSDGEWTALLPTLTPTARAVLRHRRDLTPAAVRALESFGPVDFVIAGDAAPVVEVLPATPAEPEPSEADTVPTPVDAGPFVTVGRVALGLPVVAEALRRENDNEAPPPPEGTFRIADVVARLEAFQKRQADVRPTPAAPVPAEESFRFETEETGAIRWVDGVPRGALIGLSIAQAARPAGAGVDGTAAGAFRRRARFASANLVVEGSGPAGGRWLISAEPAFDPATGRFTGYRGSGRRPAVHERAAAPRADSLRQLVHELRTPTNAIAGFSEMIEHQMLGPVAEPYREQATTMRVEAGKLLAAIDDLDAAARIDAGALPLHPEAIALASLVDRVITDLAALAAARGASVTLAGSDAVALADVRAAERAIARLTGAMVGAAATGETIALTLSDTGGTVALAVSRPLALDAYPGERILGLDDEDSPATLLGLGFALRLVRNLARSLGGSLDIGHRRITLVLPSALGATAGEARSS